MKQYGGFIPGIRAGNATSRYLTYVMNRLNTVGAVYLLFVALIPTVLIMALGLNAKLPFGGTTNPDYRGRGPRHPAPGQGPDRTVPVHRLPVRKRGPQRGLTPAWQRSPAMGRRPREEWNSPVDCSTTGAIFLPHITQSLL